MSKHEKLIAKLKTIPTDFTWQECTTLLNQLGFIKMEGDGSRVKFFNLERDCMITLHKPHPSKVLKRYAVKEIVCTLMLKGLL